VFDYVFLKYFWGWSFIDGKLMENIDG